ALFGGTCVNTGCIPTKTLLASARAAHMIHRGSDFGVLLNGGFQMDMKRVKARKDEVSAASRTGLEKSLAATKNCTVYKAHARFLSDHEIQAGEAMLHGDKIFINVGARAAIPPI